MEHAPGRGSPSPRPGAAPPTRRPPPDEPEPPAEPPLPINDPTRELRRRLLAEAEALLALPHVEAVTISVRAGTVVSLRCSREPVELTGSYRNTPEVRDTPTPDVPPSLREFYETRRAHT